MLGLSVEGERDINREREGGGWEMPGKKRQGKGKKTKKERFKENDRVCC